MRYQVGTNARNPRTIAIPANRRLCPARGGTEGRNLGSRITNVASQMDPAETKRSGNLRAENAQPSAVMPTQMIDAISKVRRESSDFPPIKNQTSTGDSTTQQLFAATKNNSRCYLYRKYFFRMESYKAKSLFHPSTIFSGATLSCNCLTVAAFPRRVNVFAKSTLSGYNFFKTAAISNPIRIERTADFSPIFMLTPPHRCPTYKPETGISNCETNLTPGKCFAFSAVATSSPFIHGAPKISNGASVPRPTEIPAFCKISKPGYRIAPFVVRKFGEGGTQRIPVLSKK